MPDVQTGILLEWLKPGKAPPGLNSEALIVATTLKDIAHPPNHWRDLRDAIMAATKNPVVLSYSTFASDPAELVRVAAVLDWVADLATHCLERLQRAGYRWDWDRKMVTEHTGHHPTLLYTGVVDALYNVWADETGRDGNYEDLRRWLSTELAPFFDPEWVKPEGKKLKNAVGKAQSVRLNRR